MLKKGNPECTLNVLLQSLSSSTLKQYESVYRFWWKYCGQHGYDPFEASQKEVLNFFNHQFNTTNNSYGSFNTYRSALSLILNWDLTSCQNIKRFLKGIFKVRPPQRKYDFSWEPQLVLDFLSTKFPNDIISFRDLAMKTATLIALITGHRIQTLARIRVDNIIIAADGIQILISDHIKTTRRNSAQPCLQIPYFIEKPEICPASALIAYITASAKFRSDQQEFLFLTTRHPYHTASTSTLSRWIRSTLGKSGIDTRIFSAYSTRHSATSAAYRNGVTLDVIRKTAGWSSRSETFAKFYNRPLNNRWKFARAVIETRIS